MCWSTTDRRVGRMESEEPATKKGADMALKTDDVKDTLKPAREEARREKEPADAS